MQILTMNNFTLFLLSDQIFNLEICAFSVSMIFFFFTYMVEFSGTCHVPQYSALEF